jgi:hypothetical protein
MQLPWVEGNQGGNNGATATTGETTWLARYFPETPWTSPGGGSGLDFAMVPSAITPLAGQGSTNEISTDAMVMDVQRWLDDPGSNFGWMLRVSDESTAQSVRRIAARESTIGGPLLIVRYLPPDSDRDGIPDSEDACPNSPTGAVVNSRGCSLGQLVPVTAPWRNRGEYVSALAAAAEEFARAGLISRQQRSEIIREAAQTAIPPIHRH